ncbi:hypothetical protein [Aeromicrobium sp. CTD01-1L150]|uniref:hypothetical protein n=1 Tax=Aeromicrobium sp. CTD01-1L150 TaxID=3341830 RepID=UPI0035BF6D20
MVDHFAHHATNHPGFDARLIRDMASDLRKHTHDVSSLVAELESLEETAETRQQINREVDRFAGHIAACADIIYDLSGRRRAS